MIIFGIAFFQNSYSQNSNPNKFTVYLIWLEDNSRSNLESKKAVYVGVAANYRLLDRWEEHKKNDKTITLQKDGWYPYKPEKWTFHAWVNDFKTQQEASEFAHDVERHAVIPKGYKIYKTAGI